MEIKRMWNTITNSENSQRRTNPQIIEDPEEKTTMNSNIINNKNSNSHKKENKTF